MAESKTLGDAILVPKVYTELNTRYILVTEWVEGVKVREAARVPSLTEKTTPRSCRCSSCGSRDVCVDKTSVRGV